MTARIGTLSIDGTPISEADLARIEAEERLHAEQQRSAVRVVAATASDAEDCRMLLSMLGLARETVLAARGAVQASSGQTAPAQAQSVKRSRRRSAAA